MIRSVLTAAAVALVLLGGVLFVADARRVREPDPPAAAAAPPTSLVAEPGAAREIARALERIEARLESLGAVQRDLATAIARLEGGVGAHGATAPDATAWDSAVDEADRRLVLDEIARLGAELRGRIAEERERLEEPDAIEYLILAHAEMDAAREIPPNVRVVYTDDVDRERRRVAGDETIRLMRRDMAPEMIERSLEALDRLSSVRTLDDLARWRAERR